MGERPPHDLVLIGTGQPEGGSERLARVSRHPGGAGVAVGAEGYGEGHQQGVATPVIPGEANAPRGILRVNEAQVWTTTEVGSRHVGSHRSGRCQRAPCRGAV